MSKSEAEDDSYFDDLVTRIYGMNVRAKFSIQKNREGRGKSFVATFPSTNARKVVEN